VGHGFRLPSALDNRPLNYDEFLDTTGPIVFTSATPAPYERQASTVCVQQLIRPTGIVDPPVEVRPLKGQIDDVIEEIRKRSERRERTLVTTLTKKTAEDLAEYLGNLGLRVKYLHSEIDAIERVEILRGCARPTSTPSSGSTCCGRAWTCRKFRWWPFWTRTRRAFSGRRLRSSRRQVARPATWTDRC
jgi:excinuclease UvrABC helicase subunit UvrB